MAHLPESLARSRVLVRTSHDSFIYVPWLIYICAMTHLRMHHDSFEYWPRWVMTHPYVCHDIYAHFFFEWRTCLYINLSGALDYWYARSCMCHDSFIYVPRLIHICAMTHSYMCHDSFIYVPWLIHICAMTHSYMCHDSSIFIHVPWVIHTRAMSVCACILFLNGARAICQSLRRSRLLVRTFIYHSDSFIYVPRLMIGTLRTQIMYQQLPTSTTPATSCIH